jgi:FMN phosphatase YigB (HAD superfamily)
MIQKKSRTIGEIAKAISKLKEQRIKEEKRKQEEKRLEELKKIENEEDFLWDRIDLLIYEKNTKSYDEAIKLLKDLKKLAIYKEKFNNFCDKIENIKLKNTKLSALKSRIEQAKLITE